MEPPPGNEHIIKIKKPKNKTKIPKKNKKTKNNLRRGKWNHHEAMSTYCGRKRVSNTLATR